MNPVIIFGGNHHNTLSTARVFGINGIKPVGIIVSHDGRNLYSSKSKYWDRCIIVDSPEVGVSVLYELYKDYDDKPVIIPTADPAETILDLNLDKLNGNYYVPSINNQSGKIAYLMDKYNQSLWANSLGIKTAKSSIILLDDANTLDLEGIPFPCILKPVASSEGEKPDITKCEDYKELLFAIDKLKQKGYSRILVQEFLNKDYEMELFGCIPIHSKVIPYILTQHLREWPTIGGTVSCHKFITSDAIRREAVKILTKIQGYGFHGLIDIELFMINGEIILNEVNFRNSGDVYACFHNHLYYPYYWYLDAIGEGIDSCNTTYSDEYYAMNEATDIRHVFYGNLKLHKWLSDLKQSKDYSLWFKGDLKPTFARYCQLARRLFKH